LLAGGNVPLEQDKAYWEVKVSELAAPCWVGVATGAAAVQDLPEEMDRCEMDMSKLWGYRSDNQEVFKGKIKAGTVVGMSYNQSSGPPTVNFFLDGELIEGVEIDGIRGVVSPSVGVSQGSSLICNFSHNFECKPSGRYENYDGVILAGNMI